MKATVFIAAAVSILASMPAVGAGGHCDADMAAVTAAMTKVKLSDADMKTVKEALARGAELDKAGKEEECEKALAPARKSSSASRTSISINRSVDSAEG